MKVLFTGATGFVGTHLLSNLPSKYSTVILGRKKFDDFNGEFFSYDLSQSEIQSCFFNNVSVVVHLAAHVHVMNNLEVESLKAFKTYNTEATLKLAKCAAANGVKRFIYLSSIKVNGESTCNEKPFTAQDTPRPEEPYGQSKFEAELNLLQLVAETGLEVVIIRPPLVYGPGVKANFASLMKLVSMGIPLPFKCITKNRRSLVSVDNLVDLILVCIEHPKAANQIFLVSDDYDLSTSQMVHQMAKSMGVSPRQISLPVWSYRLLGKILRKSDVVDRLISSLQVDITHTKETLNWTPPQSVEEGFRATVGNYLKTKKRR